MHRHLEQLLCNIQRVLPQHTLSRIIYRLMRSRRPWLKNLLIRRIAASAGVNWEEASSTDLSDYPHFNAFFTRELKPGRRPLAQATLISPCDGKISQAGGIQHDQIIQAKNHHYSIASLLAETEPTAAFMHGDFVNIYLSPKDYHRIHMPISGRLIEMRYVPGRLFSVAPYTVRHIPNLFARNERVICLFETAIGQVAVILVGAMLVSGIETVWAGEITPRPTQQPFTVHYEDKPVELNQGAELGRFNMGSTVILLLPPNQVRLEPLAAESAIQMGQVLAR